MWAQLRLPLAADGCRGGVWAYENEGTLLEASGKVSLLLKKALKPRSAISASGRVTRRDTVLQQPSWN